MTHKWKRLLASGGAIAAAVTLAACSSNSSSSTSTGSSAGSSSPASSSPGSASAGGASAGLAKAQAMVTQLEATTTSYPVPTASITGVSALAGKTVYYIPLVAAIPGFAVTASTMKVALAAAGLKLQVCDGQGNPSSISNCVKQAEGASAVGIVTDAIPYGMAQNAFDSAKSKNIPVIIADQYPPSASTTNTDALTYVPGVVDQPSQIAWWVIASSQGKANIIIAQESDSPSSLAYVQNSLSIYKDNCAGCTVTTKNITATSNNQLASDTATNLLTHPQADYYYTEFEDSLDPTVQGIQQANKSSSVSLSVAGGSVDGLGRLKQGSAVKAVVAVDQAYAGWALTDEVLRLATKSAPVTETFPSRLFTSDNIGSIQVTPAAQSSGDWFGDTSYQGSFKALWGV
jgi:ribose transport system substrate-binding protein